MRRRAEEAVLASCIFEYVHLKRPDSMFVDTGSPGLPSGAARNRRSGHGGSMRTIFRHDGST